MQIYIQWNGADLNVNTDTMYITTVMIDVLPYTKHTSIQISHKTKCQHLRHHIYMAVQINEQ